VWVTDTFHDVNGVARTIQTLAEAGRQTHKPLTVLTCLREKPGASFDLKNFEPVGEFNLPEYENQQLAVPPFLEVIEYLERERFSEIIISTPGPLGLTALAAGRLLGVKLTGIYHTDFPMYVRHLTQDAGLEQLTTKFMGWFYNQMDSIVAPSDYYRRELAEAGFDSAKLRVMRRGVDLDMFSPAKRSPRFWQKHGLGDGFKLLYVGRVSEEKNIRRLLTCFDSLVSLGTPAQLAIVGDGPLLDELRRTVRRPGVVYPGVLRGEELAVAYASADAFVFPSTTDTFGNAVLEAQASGLPALVTDRGGPQEIIEHGVTGLVADVERPGRFVQAMRMLASDAQLTRRMGEAARNRALGCDWASVLEELWSGGGAKPADTRRRAASKPVHVELAS